MNEQSEYCPVSEGLDLLTNRWTAELFRVLLGGMRRHGELLRALPGVSPKTLSVRLRELERRGLVRRVAHPEIPPRVEYSLTPAGQSVQAVFDAIGAWAEAALPNQRAPAASPVAAAG